MVLSRLSKDNVELADLLVVPRGRVIVLCPIYRIEEEHLLGLNGNETWKAEYGDAVVLKKDGTYLVGNRIKEFLLRTGVNGY
jgi:hypothetical protein